MITGDAVPYWWKSAQVLPGTREIPEGVSVISVVINKAVPIEPGVLVSERSRPASHCKFHTPIIESSHHA